MCAFKQINTYRHYDPYSQKFLSEDPIGLRGDINLYNYALNNPLIFADPTGLLSKEDVEEAWETAKEALKRKRDEWKKNLDDIKDWGDKIIDDAKEALDDFGNDVDPDEDPNSPKSPDSPQSICPSGGVR